MSTPTTAGSTRYSESAFTHRCIDLDSTRYTFYTTVGGRWTLEVIDREGYIVDCTGDASSATWLRNVR